MKLSLILEAIDRATTPIAKVERSVDRLSTGAFGRIEGAMKRVSTVSQRVLDAPLLQRFAQFDQKVTKLVTTGGRWALEKGAYATGAAIGFTLRKVGELLLRVSQLAVVGGVAAFGFLTKGVIETGSKFEGFRTQLITLLGTAKQADNALGFIQNFAAQTPYELDQVVQAFIQAKQEGIDPFSGALRIIGDAASSLGKPIEQVVAAVGDASRGQFERLLDLGITASTKGGQVALTYIDRQGKAVTTNVKKQTLDLQKAVLDIFSTRFAGGMERQSQTLAGIWSNLLDKVTIFQKQIADAGIFDLVKQKLQQLLNWTDKLSKDGTLKKWAELISNWMKSIVLRIDELFSKPGEWEKLIGYATDFATAIKAVVDAIVELKRAGDAVANFLNGIQGALNQAGDGLNRIMGGGIAQRGFYHGGLLAHHLAKPATGAPRSGPTPLPSPRANAAPKGKLEITVKAAPGISAQPTKVDRGGWDWDLYSGRAMRPF